MTINELHTLRCMICFDELAEEKAKSCGNMNCCFDMCETCFELIETVRCPHCRQTMIGKELEDVTSANGMRRAQFQGLSDQDAGRIAECFFTLVAVGSCAACYCGAFMQNPNYYYCLVADVALFMGMAGTPRRVSSS